MTPLLPVLCIAAMLSAGITISGHYLQPPRLLLIGIFKPLTTILILAVALLPGTLRLNEYTRLIAVGLVFSLIGDILLELPGRFLPGLGAFLLAQITYVIAFRSGTGAAAFPWALLVVAAAGGTVLLRLWRNLSRHMRIAVSIYVSAIALMAALALGRYLGQPSSSTLLAAGGAALFMCSDAMLAINRFARPFRLAELGVLGTYFVAQSLIALSV